MTWEPEVEEIHRRLALAEQMGGAEGVERQRKRGKLTVRERVALLADPGTFRQFGAFKGHATYGENGEIAEFTPAGQKKPTLTHHDGNFPRGYYNTRTDQDTLFLRTWVDSVHSRKPPLVNVEMAINAAGAAHLGNLAYRKNEVAKWPV